MAYKISESLSIDDLSNWGSIYSLLYTDPVCHKTSICLVDVVDLKKIAIMLSKTVQDTSWMVDLDKGTRKQYSKTSEETAEILVAIFKSQRADYEKINEEFGELMVSIGSSRALNQLLDHYALPIAELWKPRKKQNEGFDFHTVCKEERINFGEAKYSGSKNPYSDAITQTEGFINEEKHCRDRVYLRDLVHENAVANLDNNKFGAIIAFSLNTKNKNLIFKNAIELICKNKLDQKVSHIYVVGVRHEY